ncbi:MAG: hypothetical protein ACRDF5_10370 [bacterium]
MATVVRVKDGPLAGALLTVTPALLDALRISAWEEKRAEGLLQETLRRVARAYRTEWAARYHRDSPDWFEAEARIEAAALRRDTVAFVRALADYEQLARERFAQWTNETAR